MSTAGWIVVDHAVALLSVVAWFVAGGAVALRRDRLGLVFLVAATMLLPIRVFTVVMLAEAGWWFVQEKVLLGLPSLGVAGSIAVLIGARPLIRARRSPDIAVAPRVTVALLSCGYVALAGVALTFLVGYPLTWSSALIAVASVCLGAVLTARAVTSDVTGSDECTPPPGPLPAASRGVQMTRRGVLQATSGAIAVGAGGTGTALAFLPTDAVDFGRGPRHLAPEASSVSVADLRGARSAAPGCAVRRHVLTARQQAVRLPSGRVLEAWTYDGQVPGPAIVATKGDLIEVTLRNRDIEDGVTLHWHGYDVACGEDGTPGVTQNVVKPGEEFVYHFRADQVGTYWYHTHQTSHIAVHKGMYGTLVVHPRGEPVEQLDLTLAVHTFDGAVVIGDRDEQTDHAAPEGTPVRLRLVNTDSQPHVLALSGTPSRLAAVDGRDLNNPGDIGERSLRLPAGGRFDLVFNMPDEPVALIVDNDRERGVRLMPEGVSADRPPPDTSGWPELDLLHYGEPAPQHLTARDSDRHFTIVLDRGIAIVDGRPTFAHTVNGKGHPSIPDQLVAAGDLVRFTVVNRSLETHPWHLHGHPVLVLARDGQPASGSPLWVDTFDVRPGEVWEVAFEASNPGIWMNHCHNLPHAHRGMMLRLAYDGVTTPFADSHADH